MSHITLKQLQPDQFPALQRFYKQNGYKGKPGGKDQIWCLMDTEQQIVAAVRLCQQAGELILRGVWVDKQLRGKGLGAELLSQLAATGTLTECYCFPYVGLEGFYQQAGFEVVPTAPAQLNSLLERYNRKGEQVCLMHFNKPHPAGIDDN